MQSEFRTLEAFGTLCIKKLSYLILNYLNFIFSLKEITTDRQKKHELAECLVNITSLRDF